MYIEQFRSNNSQPYIHLADVHELGVGNGIKPICPKLSSSISNSKFNPPNSNPLEITSHVHRKLNNRSPASSVCRFQPSASGSCLTLNPLVGTMRRRLCHWKILLRMSRIIKCTFFYNYHPRRYTADPTVTEVVVLSSPTSTSGVVTPISQNTLA